MEDRLQYISTGRTAPEQQLHIQKALDNGAKWIQLRWKNATLLQRYLLAEQVKKQCDAYQAICIVNDDIKVAKEVDADGVHLGLEDSTVGEARMLLGKEKIIGGTANTLRDVLQRIREGCHYIGLGPFRFTTSKEKLSPVLGIQGYADIIQHLRHEHIPHPPIYAIGGIQLTDLALIKSNGIYGVAVSGLINNKPSLIKEITDILNYSHEPLTNSQ